MKLDRQTAMKAPLLKPEEEARLVHAWKIDGCEVSRDRLVMAHARLAYATARAYAPNNEAAQDDLVQHGMMALLHAARKFEPSFGKRFAGYSALWVKAYISQAASATLIVVDMPARKFMDARMGRGDLSKSSYLAAFGESSFDAPLPGSEGLTLGDVMESPDQRPDAAYDELDKQEYFQRSIGDALKLLTPREQNVIQLRRLTDPGATLEEVGRHLKVTRERVRQIEKAALGKVRKHLERSGFTPEVFS